MGVLRSGFLADSSESDVDLRFALGTANAVCGAQRLVLDGDSRRCLGRLGRGESLQARRADRSSDSIYPVAKWRSRVQPGLQELRTEFRLCLESNPEVRLAEASDG